MGNNLLSLDFDVCPNEPLDHVNGENKTQLQNGDRNGEETFKVFDENYVESLQKEDIENKLNPGISKFIAAQRKEFGFYSEKNLLQAKKKKECLEFTMKKQQKKVKKRQKKEGEEEKIKKEEKKPEEEKGEEKKPKENKEEKKLSKKEQKKLKKEEENKKNAKKKRRRRKRRKEEAKKKKEEAKKKKEEAKKKKEKKPEEKPAEEKRPEEVVEKEEEKPKEEKPKGGVDMPMIMPVKKDGKKAPPKPDCAKKAPPKKGGKSMGGVAMPVIPTKDKKAPPKPEGEKKAPPKPGGEKEVPPKPAGKKKAPPKPAAEKKTPPKPEEQKKEEEKIKEEEEKIRKGETIATAIKKFKSSTNYLEFVTTFLAHNEDRNELVLDPNGSNPNGEVKVKLQNEDPKELDPMNEIPKTETIVKENFMNSQQQLMDLLQKLDEVKRFCTTSKKNGRVLKLLFVKKNLLCKNVNRFLKWLQDLKKGETSCDGIPQGIWPFYNKHIAQLQQEYKDLLNLDEKGLTSNAFEIPSFYRECPANGKRTYFSANRKRSILKRLAFPNAIRGGCFYCLGKFCHTSQQCPWNFDPHIDDEEENEKKSEKEPENEKECPIEEMENETKLKKFVPKNDIRDYYYEDPNEVKTEGNTIHHGSIEDHYNTQVVVKRLKSKHSDLDVILKLQDEIGLWIACEDICKLLLERAYNPFRDEFLRLTQGVQIQLTHGYQSYVKERMFFSAVVIYYLRRFKKHGKGVQHACIKTEKYLKSKGCGVFLKLAETAWTNSPSKKRALIEKEEEERRKNKSKEKKMEEEKKETLDVLKEDEAIDGNDELDKDKKEGKEKKIEGKDEEKQIPQEVPAEEKETPKEVPEEEKEIPKDVPAKEKEDEKEKTLEKVTAEEKETTKKVPVEKEGEKVTEKVTVEEDVEKENDPEEAPEKKEEEKE